MQKWLVEGTPSTWNFGSKWPRSSEIADFRSLFARSDSAVTSSKKFQLILMGSPLRAFQWAHDEHRTLSLNTPCHRKVLEIWTITPITPKRYEIGCQLLLITNRKSHTGFRSYRPRWPWMTLNAVKAFIFAFFNRILQIFRPIISQWLKIDL